jgi:xylulokinase
VHDRQQRVNSFAHLNYSPESPLTGVLLCINGAGSSYRWVRENLGAGGLPERFKSSGKLGYHQLEILAAGVPIGAEGLSMLPFGNGAERMLGNQNLGGHISGLNFNRHGQGHICRAALEGIAFAFVYGMEVMREMGIPIHRLRVGNDNLFQSAVFSETIATSVGVEIESYATTGAVGAAKAAGIAVGIFESPDAALAQNLAPIEVYGPNSAKNEEYQAAYGRWREYLQAIVRQTDSYRLG